jgi:hypothetical protein
MAAPLPPQQTYSRCAAAVPSMPVRMCHVPCRQRCVRAECQQIPPSPPQMNTPTPHCPPRTHPSRAHAPPPPPTHTHTHTERERGGGGRGGNGERVGAQRGSWEMAQRGGRVRKEGRASMEGKVTRRGHALSGKEEGTAKGGEGSPTVVRGGRLRDQEEVSLWDSLSLPGSELTGWLSADPDSSTSGRLRLARPPRPKVSASPHTPHTFFTTAPHTHFCHTQNCILILHTRIAHAFLTPASHTLSSCQCIAHAFFIQPHTSILLTCILHTSASHTHSSRPHHTCILHTCITNALFTPAHYTLILHARIAHAFFRLHHTHSSRPYHTRILHVRITHAFFTPVSHRRSPHSCCTRFTKSGCQAGPDNTIHEYGLHALFENIMGCHGRSCD